MEPQAVAEIANGLATALENAQLTDYRQLLSLGNALAALAAGMEPQAAAEIANGLATALENAQLTDYGQLSSLGNALAALAARMEPAGYGGDRKTRCPAPCSGLRESAGNGFRPAFEPRKTLAAFCALLPSAPHTHLLALSNLLLTPVPEKEDEGEERPYDRKLLTAVCAQLSPQDLAEVLKYPFCTGEAEQIVLKQSDSKTQRNFGGDVWKFVEQANSLGIKDIADPAKRPSVQDALNELNKL